MPWSVWARSGRKDPASENSEVTNVIDPSDPLEILGTAWALREMVELVTPEEFSWHDAHYDDDSAHGRELLFLIANHEWVRATSEVVEVVRSDVIETTIKADIDLSLIKHEAFGGNRAVSGFRSQFCPLRSASASLNQTYLPRWLMRPVTCSRCFPPTTSGTRCRLPWQKSSSIWPWPTGLIGATRLHG